MKALQNLFLLSLCILGAYLWTAGCFEPSLFKAALGIFPGTGIFAIAAGIMYDLNVVKYHV